MTRLPRNVIAVCGLIVSYWVASFLVLFANGIPCNVYYGLPWEGLEGLVHYAWVTLGVLPNGGYIVPELGDPCPPDWVAPVSPNRYPVFYLVVDLLFISCFFLGALVALSCARMVANLIRLRRSRGGPSVRSLWTRCMVPGVCFVLCCGIIHLQWRPIVVRDFSIITVREALPIDRVMRGLWVRLGLIGSLFDKRTAAVYAAGPSWVEALHVATVGAIRTLPILAIVGFLCRCPEALVVGGLHPKCEACGYCLWGIESVRCPECGAARRAGPVSGVQNVDRPPERPTDEE